MPTALIADDEPLMRAMLLEHLETLWPELEVVAQAENGVEALRELERHRPDVAFLDIRMPGMTGLEVARAADAATQIVFVTAFDNHAVEAFESNAVDYVLKPIETVRLAKVVSKLRRSLDAPSPHDWEQLQFTLASMGLGAAQSAGRAPAEAARPAPVGGSLDWLQVSIGSQIRMARLPDVAYFQAVEKYTLVVTPEWRGDIRLSLKQILQQAPSGQLLQIHRATVINRAFLRSVHRTQGRMSVELRGIAERLDVSESNQGLFKGM